MSRRKFLGLGAGALATFGLGTAAHSRSFGSLFSEPEVRSSANGFLSTTLRASTVPTTVFGGPVVTSVYEGLFPGPTLKIRPGDFVRVELINDLDEETNLHVHGMHVSPLTPGDNVLLNILPGQRFVYEYTLPANHPAGTYFYHPHRHGLVTNQVFKGMAGLIIVEGDIDAIPGIAGLPERSLVLQRTFTRDGHVPDLAPNRGQRQGDVLVNGARTPVLYIRPGETQRWRLLNASVASLWRIQIEDHPMTLIAQDGNTLAQATTVDSMFLSTAQRREVLIQGGRPGIYTVTYQDLQGPFGTPPAPVPLAYLVSTGVPVDPQPLPTTLLPFVDLRTVPVDRQRAITFQIVGDPASPTFAGQGFVIDGQPFDHNRIDQFANLGTTEEWTITNTSTLFHPFHIHINPFQVTGINGQPHDALSYVDTVPVPPNGGSITFRTRFLDFAGTWVYHCHILGHEDGGMMGIIQVS
jgi:FtsP/CotA-like multicopper oxidase with cupredoxin domain